MNEEFDSFKKAYPSMDFIEVKPTIAVDQNNVLRIANQPIKGDYLHAISKAIKQSF